MRISPPFPQRRYTAARRTSARGFVLALILLLLSVAGSQAGESVLLGLESRLDMMGRSGESGYLPCRILLVNRGQEREILVEATATAAGYYGESSTSQARRTLRVPPGETRVELPLNCPSSSASIQVNFEVDGRRVRELGCNHWSGSSREGAELLVVGSGEEAFRKILSARAGSSSSSSSSRNELRLGTATAGELALYWQSYLGWDGALVLEAGEAARLSAAQREAIRRWVCYGGGVVWFHGENAATLPAAIEPFRFSIQPEALKAGQQVLPCGAGKILKSRTDQAEESINDIAHILQQDRFRDLYRLGQAASGRDYRYYGNGGRDLPSSSHFFGHLFEGLHTIPVLGLVILSIVLALVIGPVNLFLLARRRRLILFYITAPLLSIAGMLGIGGYLVLRDGLNVRAQEWAVLLHNLDSGRGAIYQARAFFTGMAPRGGLNYSSDVAAVPFRSDAGERSGSDGIHCRTDWTDAQRLTDGWINGRSLDGVLTVAPVRVRLGIELRPDGRGGFSVTNNLTGMVRQLVVRQGDQNWTLRSPLAPGKNAPLIREEKIVRENKWVMPAGWVPEWLRALPQAVLFATVENLPHLDDGGVEAETIARTYYYVALKANGLPVEAEAKGTAAKHPVDSEDWEEEGDAGKEAAHE